MPEQIGSVDKHTMSVAIAIIKVKVTGEQQI